MDCVGRLKGQWSPVTRNSRHDRSVSNRKPFPGFLLLLCAVLFLTGLSTLLPGPATAQTRASAIGKVETLQGRAFAFRASNRRDRLDVGSEIYSGDTIQTGPATTIGIVFVDRTVFSMSANATLAINDLVYNAAGNSNRMAVDLVEGSFAFLTGAIAKSGSMNVETSVAQLGIRGTQPWVTVGPATSFTIMSERDGTTGEYVLVRKGTQTVIATVNRSTVGTTRKYVMTGPADTPRLVEKSPGEPALERALKRNIEDALQSSDSRSGRGPARGRGRAPGREGRGRGPGEAPGDGPDDGESDNDSDSESSGQGNGDGGDSGGAGDR